MFSPEYLNQIKLVPDTYDRRESKAEQGIENIRNVQESVIVFMLFVNAAHQSCGGRKHLVDEDEDGLLGRQLDTLADDVDELADGEIGRDEIFLLVDGGNVGFLNLFADNLYRMSFRQQTGSAKARDRPHAQDLMSSGREGGRAGSIGEGEKSVLEFDLHISV